MGPIASYAEGRFNHGSITMGSTFNGLVGLVILALDIWAIINVIKSGASGGAKVLWILLILLLPVLGLIIWAIAGPRGNVRL
jgi:succinate dehydrogenase/fumarate reductase cytochrome b subunit